MTKLIVEDRIDRPAKDVFEAIVTVEGLSSFFVATTSGPMVPGTTVTWSFPHVDATFDVAIGEIEPDRFVSWSWPGGQVTIELAETGGGTALTITEQPMGDDVEGAARAAGQTQGWTYFVCTLRAHLLHGIRHFGLSDGIRATVSA
ncbi:SRPBCC domain-containing protein [Streptomyces sp. VRA16 Mangrove soil]|uniref:SRPBCC domain-containing protein n=1 Tax=Streptomyces sp. VRA16 Mangrove soil TaxID=2817434 RepID=UPI001A9F9E93|nr:SRPBCC domain-containing protein [Streptomyces sp. VRA16 Mangrove soil]MBO1331845.1 SRPBCC domain-containing protein [Streptomyces sp. VRA16 Mangrove soil]